MQIKNSTSLKRLKTFFVVTNMVSEPNLKRPPFADNGVGGKSDTPREIESKTFRDLLE